MRFVVALAVLLSASPSLARDSSTPLPPGKPAGVAQAEINNHDLFIYIGIGAMAAAAGGMAVILGHSSSSATTTTP